MNRSVFLSLLAMDSYQRGSAVGIRGVTGTAIGSATILDLELPANSLAIGFSASVYQWGSDKVISYRGTDFDEGVDEAQEFIKDLANGWTSFLAPTSGLQTQFDHARAFFKSVTGGDFNDGETYNDLIVTGHSLGGALAGFVDARADVKSYLVDPIPYGVTAWISAIKDAWDATLEDLSETVVGAAAVLDPDYAGPIDEFAQLFEAHLNARRPSLPNIEGVYLEGEIASRILELQPQLAGLLTGVGLGATALTAPIPGVNIIGATVGGLLTALGVFEVVNGALNNAIEDRSGLSSQADYGAADLFPGGLVNAYANAVQLHSPSLIAMLQYGDKQWADDGGNGAFTGLWRDVAKYVFAGVYDEAVASELEIEIGGTLHKLKKGLNESDGTGLTSAAEQLGRIIAYSAINEGTRVFGDTGIRSLFNDADDMGALLDSALTPVNLLPSSLDEDMKKRLGRLAAEYAGLLATRKIEMADDDEATNGIFSYRRGTDNNGFLIDLRESVWSKGGEYHESVVKADIVNGFLETQENAYVDFGSVKKWYAKYGSPGGDLLADIDEIILSLTLGKVAAARDEAGVALQLGSSADDDQSFGAGTDFVLGGAGNDRLRGAGGGDILLGGSGIDNLYGDGGVDRLQGGADEDFLSGGADDDFLIVERDGVRDVLDGGDGVDTVVYSFDLAANVSLDSPTVQGELGPLDFGISFSAKNLNYGNSSFGPDELVSIERAAIEASSNDDTLFIVGNGAGLRVNDIAYIDLGRGRDDIDLSTWTTNASVDLAAERVSWTSSGSGGGKVTNNLTVIGAEVVLAGSGNDFLQSRDEAGTNFHLAGGAGNDLIRGLGGNDLLEGGAGNDTIVSIGGINTIVDREGSNFIISRGDHDTVVIDGSKSHIELGSKTFIVGADADDTVSRFGIALHGGVQQWWNESGTAIWSPYNALLSAFPFIGAQALFSVAAMAADATYMKFAKYRVDAETGDLLIDLGWGLGGAARIADYQLDFATGKGTAGLTIFRQGRVKQGSNSGIKASNGVEQYVNLALYSGWGHGLEGFDPLVLDLDDNGYDLISREYSQVYFEFDSDGFAENAGWIGGNDAFLVRDVNGNGQIDNITEMFGNRTTSGFTALAALDSNGDGIFSIADADFSSVRLWKDANSNGVTDAGELISLADAGIASISLTATTLSDTDVRGNVVVREASFTRSDGTTGKVGDIALDVSDTDTRWTGAQTPSQAAAALPQIAGIGELVNLRLAMTSDATLLSMVNSFVANSSASITELRGDVADILYRWAGVDGVAATAIGSGGFDARKLAFLEKFVGIQLMPRGAGGTILTTNLAEVEALWNNQFNQMAFKLIAQGPLATEFAGLTYYESHDLLRAANADTVATILAGFLDDMPVDAVAAAAYWADWGPLLGAFAGSVMRTSGIEVGRDYFFAELVKAAGSRTLALDIEALAEGLAIDGLKIGGVSALTRTADDSGTLTYYSEVGNQQFVGGAGQDAYVFGHAIGNAVINDNEAREGGDRIRFAFLTPDDVKMARDGNDLLITVTSTGETVRVLGQFAPVTTLGADYVLSSNKGVEEIQFANGTIYEVSDIAIAVGKGSAGNDTLNGTMHSDVLQGLAGNDLLMGGDDADIYVVNGGEGQDIIREVQTTAMLRAADMLIFGENVSPDDIEFIREGTGYDDLRIKIGTGDDSVLIEGQFGYSALGYTGPLALNSRIEGFSFRHYGAAWSSKEIEALLIERATTAGDDIARGFGNYDHFQISAGNDVLIGMDGGDIYEFGVGAGNDTIDEQSRFIDVTVGLGGLANSVENDIVRFKGLTLADVSFKRLSAAPDLTITINATGETLTVKGQFDGFQTGFFAAQWLHRIERFEFADGAVLNWQQVAAMTTTGGDGDDQLWGDLYADHMVGGKGNDTLSGGGKGDEYIFNVGDGQDVIYDNNQFILGDGILNVDNSPDYVTLGEGITEEMIALSRDGNDLTLHIGSAGDSITLKSQNSFLNTGVFGVWGPSRIEEIRFANGAVWGWESLNTRWIVQQTTAGDDVINGFALQDIFEASAGNDIFSGGDSGDIYRFGLGSGQDIIRENVANVMYGDTDSVEFAAGIASEDVQLSRIGSDLVVSLSDGSSLTIEGQFSYLAWYTWQDIELFKFSNGVTWTAEDVRLRFLTSTAGDDVITGFSDDDVIDGGAGNDILRGENGADTYHFDIGYGHDIIEERVSNTNLSDNDRVIFGPGILPEDLAVARDGDNLIFTIISTGETLTVEGQFDFANWFAWEDVERFEFADGTVWTDRDIAVRLTGGTPGDDTILGTFRSDTLDGGAGNDVLIGGDGSDIYIFGRGYGQDEIRESLSNANLSENDELRFGPGITIDDLTFTRDGEDLLISINGASDSIRLSRQWNVSNIYHWHDVERFTFEDGSVLTNDEIRARVLGGTTGVDHIVGFVTGDRLDGGAGDDILEGLDGADTYVFGYGSGHDQIIETVNNANFSDNDSIEFGPGISWEDLTFVRDGHDLTILLPGGQDSLFIGGQLGTMGATNTYTWRDIESFKFQDGTVKNKEDLRLTLLAAASTDGDDVIDDFYTNDTLIGGLGNDTLRGSRGSDTFVHNLGDGHDIVSDYVNYHGSSGDRILFGTGITPDDVTVSVSPTNAADMLLSVNGGQSSVTLKNQVGASRDWQIDSVEFADGTIWSALELSRRFVEGFGTPGDDVISGTGNPDTLGGGAGDDTISGGGGNDELFGGTGNDTLIGDAGNDRLTGGIGNDIMRGGTDNDVYVYAPGDGDDVIDEWHGFHGSYDVLEFGAGIAPDDLIFTHLNDAYVITFAHIQGSLTLNYQRTGGRSGGREGGVNEFRFADGTIWSRAEIDAAYLSQQVTAGDDVITGSVREDVMVGAEGNDTLIGDAGNDRLTGGVGNDIMRGGTENDVYVYALGDGDDVIDEWHEFHGSYDVLEFGVGIAPEDLILTRSNDAYVVTFAHSQGSLTLNYQRTGGRSGGREGGVNEFRFADGTIWSRAEIDAAYLSQQVTAGDDVITGSVRDDVIAGSAGNDTLIGDAGSDRLVGDEGNDTARGGAGNDVYVYALGDGDDVIDEWVTWDGSYDALEFGAGIDPEDLVFTRSGDSYVVTFANAPGSLTLYYQRTGGGWGGREGGINEFRFADGTIWSRAQIDAGYLASQATAGNDAITGSIRDDVIQGHGGDDTLAGDAGNDIFVYSLGDGDDVVDDLSGQNIVQLGIGISPADIYFSTSASNPNDVVIRFAGNPGSITLKNQLTVSATANIHAIQFADGTIWDQAMIRAEYLSRQGTTGDDYLGGDSGANVLNGGGGNDNIRAQGGEDQLTGGAGSDRLDGGVGNDSYHYALGDGSDIIADSGTDALDKLVLGAGITTADILLDPDPANAANMIIRFTGSGDTILVEEQWNGAKGLERIEFADGAVWNSAEIATQFALGGGREGNDTLAGTSGNDTMAGGGGDDTLRAYGGNDILIGGTGNDTLSGGAGNDIYRFAIGDGQDVISDSHSGSSGGGVDTIEFASGIAPDDIVVSQLANGTDLVLSIGGSSITVQSTLTHSGYRIEQVRFADGTIWSHADLVARATSATFGDDIFYGSYDADTLAGGAGNDTLRSHTGDDILIGGAGDDLLFGGGGNDTYRFELGDGQDVILDGSGGTDAIEFAAGIAPDDVVVSQLANGTDLVLMVGGDSITVQQTMVDSNDRIEQVRFADGTIWTHAELVTRSAIATSGDDIFYGSYDADTLEGGAGNDTLRAHTGNDVLIGGIGNDLLVGGGGNDTYRFELGDGQDIVLDGSGGTDTIEFAAGIAPGDVIVSQLANGADLVLTVGGNSITIQRTMVDSSDRIEQIRFADGTIWTHAELVTRSAIATSGDDIFYGSYDADTLEGGAGNDTLRAHTGNDVLIGGIGNDLLVGGGGNDTYRFDLGDGQDIILDGSGGTDTIEFAAGIAPGDVVVSQLANGTDLVLTVGANSITIQRTLNQSDNRIEQVRFADGTIWAHAELVTKSTIPTSGDDVFYGSYDADNLVGGDGNDTLIAGSGNDTLSGGAGDDILNGSSGVDTVDYSYSETGIAVSLAITTAQTVAVSDTDTITNIENLTGGSGNDTLTGSSSANVIRGGLGDDAISGGAGNDSIDGGAGTDQAIFAGVSTTYSIITSGGNVSIADTASGADGNDGTDQLIGIEQLVFKNGVTVNISSPIILDLDGGGVVTLSASESSSRFDMDGDGRGDDTSWMGNGEGMLFLDRDGNGTVSNSGEFSFINDVEGATSDLAGLRAFDSNADGSLSSADVRFADFRIWQDRNGNGAADQGEIFSLAGAGVQSIGLAGAAVNGTAALGDVVTINTGSFTRTDGTSASFIDAAFTYFSGASQQNALSFFKQQFGPFIRRQFNSFDWNGLHGRRHRELQVDWQFSRDSIAYWPQLDSQREWANGSAIMDIDRPNQATRTPISMPASASSIDRQLAMIVQEMNVFGIRPAIENLHSLHRDNVPPFEFFA